jgi:predicted ribosome quality control (RQC) complex YloA/Tae2 family protein
VLSRELTRRLAGRYLSNIYSIGEAQLFRWRRGSENEGESLEASLVLSPRFGAWITEKPARVETTEFTTALRAHILREKLASVEQIDLDRVLILRFEGRKGSPLGLLLELRPPGNIVLLGEDDKVILALREFRTEARRLMRGLRYAPPPQARSSIESLTAEGLEEALEKEKTIGRALGKSLSIPRKYVDEILARVSMKQDDTKDVTMGKVQLIVSAARDLLKEVEDAPYPCLVKAGAETEVLVVRPKQAEVIESALALSPLLDTLLFDDMLEAEERGSGASTEGRDQKEAGANERRVQEFRATIVGLESKKEALTRLASGLRDLASRTRPAPDAEAALEMAKKAGIVPGDLISSLGSLSERGPASISSALFDRAKTLERETFEIDTAIKGIQAKLKKEDGRGERVRKKVVPLSQAKREWYEKFRWFLTTGGRLAIGGRDAQSNSMLIRRHLQEGDTVYHADLFGSPFFVLKGGREQSEPEIREVAKATVSFSSAWKTGLGAADAYWVNPDQVGSAGPSGEFLAHGSFAIKGKKNFVTKNPVEVSLGVDEKGRIVAGPEESVMRVAKGHVTLVPSRDKPSDTAKKVLHELTPFAKEGLSFGVDDILRMLPAGGGKIIRRRADNKAA